MLNDLKWMNVIQRMQINILPFIQKIKTGDAPKYLIEQHRYVGETQPYHLRNEGNFRTPRTTTTNMQMPLLFKGLHLYNMLPIETETNINVFKRKILYFIKNNLLN